MEKKQRLEQRSYSPWKPLVYLLLQIIITWEFFWIVTGSANLSSWNYLALLVCAVMISYFFIKTMRILKRTPKDNAWSDLIKAQKFLNS